MLFLFVFLFWDTYDSNIRAFNIVPEVSVVVLISFHSFIFFPLCFIYFHHSIFHLTHLLTQLFYCWFPPEFWSSYCIIHCDLLFFISSISLLNISCIFSILVSSLFICNCILFSWYWIIFTFTILNFFQVNSLDPPLLFGLVGIYHVPLPAEYFSAFSFCLYCCVWGCLSVCWEFVFLFIVEVAPCGWG